MIKKREYYFFGISAIIIILVLEIPVILKFSLIARSPPPSSPIEWRKIWGGNDDIIYEIQNILIHIIVMYSIILIIKHSL